MGTMYNYPQKTMNINGEKKINSVKSVSKYWTVTENEQYLLLSKGIITGLNLTHTHTHHPKKQKPNGEAAVYRYSCLFYNKNSNLLQFTQTTNFPPFFSFAATGSIVGIQQNLRNYRKPLTSKQSTNFESSYLYSVFRTAETPFRTEHTYTIHNSIYVSPCHVDAN